MAGIAVVVPTRNRAGLITETVAAVLRQADPDFDLLVSDQSSDDRTEQAVLAAAAGDARVRVLRSPTVGSSAARNAGALATSSDVVAYLDDDCIADPGWLGAIRAEFGDPRVDAVYGRLLPFEGTARTGLEVGYKPSEERVVHDRPLPPWYVGHGGNMAFRRCALEAVGLFDPVLGAGARLRAAEDLDLTYRLLVAGRRVVYAPAALAYHKHWKDWPAQKRMERAYGIGAGAMFAKHMRCGDPYGLRLLATWVWQLGVRRLGAGLLKWRSARNMYLGYCQLVYPWLGILRSLPLRVDRAGRTYAAD